MIPGRDRRRAVIMADHYDTAYMEDRYEKARGGNGARLAAAGADDNHSATAALMLGAPIFMELQPGRPAGVRRVAGASDRRGVPFRLHGRPAPGPERRRGRLASCVCTGGRRRDLSKVQIEGVYVLDMIAHNNDHDRDVFQISPGVGRESLRLAYHAHVANAPVERLRAGVEPARRAGAAADCYAAAGEGADGNCTMPATALHPVLHGEVRTPDDPRSSLYNTDGQIFSDAGIPVVLFMENYDINRVGYHDTHDTMANIDLDYGAAVAAIAIETVARAAERTIVPSPSGRGARLLDDPSRGARNIPDSPRISEFRQPPAVGSAPDALLRPTNYTESTRAPRTSTALVACIGSTNAWAVSLQAIIRSHPCSSSSWLAGGKHLTNSGGNRAIALCVTRFDTERRKGRVPTQSVGASQISQVRGTDLPSALTLRVISFPRPRRLDAGKVFGIPTVEHCPPVGRLGDGHEGVADFLVVRVQPGVLDAELPHHPAATAGAVDLFGQPIVLGDHVALAVQAGRRQQPTPGGQRARACSKIHGLPIAPRATETPSTPVSRSMSRQSWAVNRSPLPSTVRGPACCFTSRRNSRELTPS